MFPNREGQRVPQAAFRVRTENGEWQTLMTDAVFKDETVVAFSLPGAFTPTCSSMHVPRYNELAPAFYANGVDRVVCISVNDAFVMDEWARVQECGNVLMLPDGNGEFTGKMGMLVDKTELGFGQTGRAAELGKQGLCVAVLVFCFDHTKEGRPLSGCWQLRYE